MAKRKTLGRYHGYLVIDKPAGWTSHDVVGKVRRMLHERRVGHAGTLDPAAVGVLPVAIGLATRTVEYLVGSSKAYVADITFGVVTDTADSDGVVTSVTDAQHLRKDDIVQALTRFEGIQLQKPPMHSAIKVAGQRLYERARRGEIIEVAARPITIEQIALEGWEPPTARIRVDCSKGTYIRSLARDIGETVGTGAHLSHLVRIRTGPFWLEDAITLDELESLLATRSWQEIAYHPDVALLDWPAVIVDEQQSATWRTGGAIPVTAQGDDVRVYDDVGNWLGVGRIDTTRNLLRPIKVVTDVTEE